MCDAHCDTIRDRIDAFLDGELDAGEGAVVESHLARCEACATEVRLALRVREELRSWPPLAAPRHVVDAAERAALGRLRATPLPAHRTPNRVLPAIAAALVLAAATVWIVSERRLHSTPGYSDAEIRHASEEVALAFAYVDRYSGHTAGIVRDDVLGKRVMPRIERALVTSGEAAVHDALVPGLKRAMRESGLNVTSPAPGRS